MIIKALIQVRMNSSRYPGKALAPLGGRTLILRVLDAVGRAVDPANMVIVTSLEPTDDPIASFASDCRVNLYRGSLDNVFKRYRDCLLEYECDYFFRVCGDSPFLDPGLFRQAASAAGQDRRLDLVTNAFPRTFPAGKTVELVKSETFLLVDSEKLSDLEKEHLTRHFYEHHERYKIYNIERGNRSYLRESYTVDTVEDLKGLGEQAVELEKETEKETEF